MCFRYDSRFASFAMKRNKKIVEALRPGDRAI